MKKTLILVVDRDDDFGTKGGIASPIIGIDACADAANALGIADPEDSDTNALFAAINIYHSMAETRRPGTYEVALICGNRKVGYLSDEAVVDELEQVLEEVKPTGVILVGDGAEDESVYPIISSRVPIDSVRKVYVKQAPGLEGTFYLISQTLKDPQKKERFLAPIAWIFLLISSAYIFADFFRNNENIGESVLDNPTTFIFLIIGLALLYTSYSVSDRLRMWWTLWSNRAKSGSLVVVFMIASMLFVVVGVFIGLFSIDQTYTRSGSERFLVFAGNALWPALFGVMLYTLGGLIDNYASNGTVKYSFITKMLSLVAIGLFLTGILDMWANTIGFYSTGKTLVITEVLSGFLLAIFATLNQYRVSRALSSKRGPEDGTF